MRPFPVVKGATESIELRGIVMCKPYPDELYRTVYFQRKMLDKLSPFIPFKRDTEGEEDRADGFHIPRAFSSSSSEGRVLEFSRVSILSNCSFVYFFRIFLSFRKYVLNKSILSTHSNLFLTAS